MLLFNNIILMVSVILALILSFFMLVLNKNLVSYFENLKPLIGEEGAKPLLIYKNYPHLIGFLIVFSLVFLNLLNLALIITLIIGLLNFYQVYSITTLSKFKNLDYQLLFKQLLSTLLIELRVFLTTFSSAITLLWIVLFTKSPKLNNSTTNISFKLQPLGVLQRLPFIFIYNIKLSTLCDAIFQHYVVLYNFFKTTIIALLLMSVYFFYTIFFFKLQFLKQLAVWFIIGMLYFWLISCFNFFLKRYQFGKFTSQIQRFWKRTNTYFWLIEGFLILLFFYYYLNSSQEPVYMYDYSALNQEYLVSLHVAGTNIILLSLVIYFMYFVLFRINSNTWAQLNLYLLIISSFIFFSFFIETYQFYYVISTFNERFWSFNEEENLWSIEIDNPILRTKQQYLLVCLIAKYWHFLFIFLSWVFFLIKSFERRKVTYVLFGANLQNIIILYVLNLACYLQWAKWLYRRFFDLPYTWFMTNNDNKLIFRFFLESKLLLSNIISFNGDSKTFGNIIYKSLTLWNVDALAIWKLI